MAIHAAGDGDEPRSTIKFLCSYGGRILPRKPYGKLCYSGGFTRILSVHPSISYPELMARLEEFCGFSVVLRCQLPSCDLETLVTIKSDEDLANLVEEYRKESPRWPQKIKAVLSTTAGSPKVLPPPPPSSSSSSSPASSADSSGCNSPMHEASDGNCVQNRPGRLRCYPCNVEPGAGAVRRMRCLGH